MKRARQTILPGRNGTKKLLEKYGEKLVNVRYRYDLENKRRITTVELIENETPWIPNKIPMDEIVKIKVAWGEDILANKIKVAGGKWNKEQKVWELPYRAVNNLGIQSRIVR
jgi:hypothetical protein